MAKTDASANNKRIAKNTLMLYFRMLLIMAVTFYTSRVVLQTLGIVDYGIYNVVGGIVAMFGFLNSAMASGTQRYLTFELGRGDKCRLKKVFVTSMNIHIIISIIVFILAETVGLWLLYNKMTIPDNRFNAAFWVYQCSILSTMVMFVSVPYNATIIAHEKMNAFAYISILEVILKLLIVYLLLLGDIDKLILYAVLMLIVQLTIRFTYNIYCKRNFEETDYSFVFDKSLFKEMMSFSGWNLWGNMAVVAFTQGLNILLNMFFGPAVNAARGVAVQVQHAVTQFSMNFQTAINPQITKSYATGNFSYMYSLIFRSSRFTFFLLLCICLPIFMETETLLGIWLKEVPAYSAIFLRLILCVTIIDAVANPLMVSAQATGKIKLYQSAVGGILLMILPSSYIVLKLGGNPQSVFIVHIIICLIAFCLRLFIIKRLIKLSLRLYLKEVVLRCFLVGFCASIVPFAFKYYMVDSLPTSIFICIISILSVIVITFSLGMTVNEKRTILSKLKYLKNRSPL